MQYHKQKLTPMERYTRDYLKIAGIVYVVGGTLGLVGLVVATLLTNTAI